MVSEKEKTGPDSESSVDLRKDQAFKELIHDGYILAAIIGGVIPEFKGRTRDEILKCLQTGANGRYVKGRDTESVSSENGPIIRDSVFDVKLPESEGDMEVIVSIEGQGPGMSEAELVNREQIYSSRLICDQGNGMRNSDLYKNLKKTVSIWVKLSPGASEKNRIVHDYRVREFSDGSG